MVTRQFKDRNGVYSGRLTNTMNGRQSSVPSELTQGRESEVHECTTGAKALRTARCYLDRRFDVSCRVSAEILSSVRSALLTAPESLNTLATSGSSTTTLDTLVTTCR